MFSLRNKKNYLLIILITPSYLELWFQLGQLNDHLFGFHQSEAMFHNDFGFATVHGRIYFRNFFFFKCIRINDFCPEIA